MFSPSRYFDLSSEPLAYLFDGLENVWEVLPKLPAIAKQLTETPLNLGEVHPTAIIEGAVFIAEGVRIAPHVHIQGPVYLGKNAEVRHGAFIRPNSIIGEHCVVGHDSEIKSSLMLSHSHAPHFAYVGDSILGRKVNLGSGTALANFKLAGDEIVLAYEGSRIPTGLRKMGAIIGDYSSLGCNTVTAPGTIIGKNSFIYSLISLRGVIPENSIVKPQAGFVIEERR